MHVLVDRVKSGPNSTLSEVSIDGCFTCYGLEDEFRLLKVHGKKRISAALYRVGVRKSGGFHTRYLRRFAHLLGFHRGMLHILDVDDFNYILIHIGNYHHETDGCLLLGQDWARYDGSDFWVKRSSAAYRDFYGKVIGAALRGDLTIEFRDNDR
ncbi:MAG: DUF5675 family protein [Aquisalinus sp.]|nr:DUF5675 family protein [Aquisalinus sp.]